MSREVDFLVRVIVEDDQATHVTIDEGGEPYSYKCKPKHGACGWNGESSTSCKIKNWKDLCIELPEPVTDWSKVKPLTKVMIGNTLCEFLQYEAEIDSMRVITPSNVVVQVYSKLVKLQ